MSASLHGLQQDLDNLIKPLLKEILEKLNMISEANIKDLIEAAAAKIISEMKKCPCNQEILEAINKPDKGKEIVPQEPQENKQRYHKPYLYSFPNHSVGNEELGTGKNPHSLTWPFDIKQVKK